MTNLKKTQRYYIKISDTYYYFVIENNHKGYYLNFIGNWNDWLFNLSKINPDDFSEKILGYYHGGVFPYCETIEDVTKLLFELLIEMKKRNIIFICNFEYNKCDSISCWND